MDSKAQDGYSLPNIRVDILHNIMIDVLWGEISVHIKKATDKAPFDLSVDIVKEMLNEGSSVLVAAFDGDEVIGVNVIEIITYRTKHVVLFIHLTAGIRMKEWMHEALGIAHLIAKKYNCDEIRGAACRGGWSELLKRDNSQEWYELHQIIGCKIK